MGVVVNDLIDDAFAAFLATHESLDRDVEAMRLAFRAGWFALDHTLRVALIEPQDTTDSPVSDVS